MTITGGTTAAGPSGMTTLTLEDGTKTVVSIDLVGNFIGDTFTVTPIGGAKTVAVTSGRRPDDGHGRRISRAQEATLNGLPGGFDISDTAANIDAGLAQPSKPTKSHIDSIVSTSAIRRCRRDKFRSR